MSLYCQTDRFTLPNGDALPGYRVRALDLTTGAVVPIFSDQNGTPLANNETFQDDLGNYTFFIAHGVYSVEFSHPTTGGRAGFRPYVNMSSADGLRSDLALPTGAGLVGRTGGDTVQSYFDHRKNVLTPFDFGAVGDGVTDDTAALVAMAAAVDALIDNSHDSYYNELTPLVWLPPCGGFKLDHAAGIEINAGFDLVSDAPILVVGTASAARPCWVIKDGRGVVNQAPRRNKLEFDVRRLMQSNWSNTTPAVLVECLYAPYIHAKYIEGFQCGVDGGGSYLEMHIGEIYNCQEPVRWKTFNNGLSGEFSNALKITGREIRCDSGAPLGMSRWGVVLVADAPSGINTAEIHVQSYELGIALAQSGNPAGVAHPVRLDATLANISNVKITGRSEGNNREFVEIVTGTGTVYEVDLTVTQQNSRTGEPDSKLIKLPATGCSGVAGRRAMGVNVMQSIFRSGNFADNAVVGGGGQLIDLRNMEVLRMDGGFQENSNGGSNYFDATGHLIPYRDDDEESTQIHGVMINLNGERTLGLSVLKAAGSPIDLIIKCFDASGAVITSAGAVMQQYSPAAYNGSLFGGSYNMRWCAVSDDTDFQDDLGFASNVARVFIGLWRLTISPSARYRSMEIRSPLALAQVVSGGTNRLDGQLVLPSIPDNMPTGVTNKPGTRAYRSTPTVGAPQGWVFDGSIWRAMANL